MSYKQLFLLILTIWSAELFTRFLFDTVLEPQASVEFRTVYLAKDVEKQKFLGSSMKEIGARGWKIVSVQPDPDDRDQFIVFMQRRNVVRIEVGSRDD